MYNQPSVALGFASMDMEPVATEPIDRRADLKDVSIHKFLYQEGGDGGIEGKGEP